MSAVGDARKRTQQTPAGTLTDTERHARAGAWNAINQTIADHPMWIGDDGQPLDYSPEREARISDFIAETSDAVASMLAEANKVAVAAALAPIEALADKFTGMADELDRSGDRSDSAIAAAGAYDSAAYLIRAALAGGGNRG